MDATQPVDEPAHLAARPESLAAALARAAWRPETSYLACVVPAFDAGRKAGLGEEVKAADEDELAPAWDGSKPVVTLPVYYHWEFATGSGGDFETLARRLRPQPVAANVGRRPLRVGTQPFGLPDGGVLAARGRARRAGRRSRDRLPTAAFRDELRKLVNLGVGPVVAPPVYGRWQSARRHGPRRHRPAGVAARPEPRPVRRARSPGSAWSSSRTSRSSSSRPRGTSSAIRPPCAPSSGGSRSRSPCSGRSSAAASRRWSPDASCSSSARRAPGCACRRRPCTPRSRGRDCRPRSARRRSVAPSGRSRRRRSASRARRCRSRRSRAGSAPRCRCSGSRAERQAPSPGR